MTVPPLSMLMSPGVTKPAPPENTALRDVVEPVVTVALPAALGVPDTTPEAESVRPAGSEPPVIAKVYGAVPPLPAIVWL